MIKQKMSKISQKKMGRDRDRDRDPGVKRGRMAGLRRKKGGKAGIVDPPHFQTKLRSHTLCHQLDATASDTLCGPNEVSLPRCK